MFLIYNENEKRTGGGFNPNDFDPNACIRKHFENEAYLKFILGASDDFSERQQARKELDICERKQNYWKKHPQYDPTIAASDIKEIRQKWARR
jgi:hypothetical protein